MTLRICDIIFCHIRVGSLLSISFWIWFILLIFFHHIPTVIFSVRTQTQNFRIATNTIPHQVIPAVAAKLSPPLSIRRLNIVAVAPLPLPRLHLCHCSSIAIAAPIFHYYSHHTSTTVAEPQPPYDHHYRHRNLWYRRWKITIPWQSAA